MKTKWYGSGATEIYDYIREEIGTHGPCGCGFCIMEFGSLRAAGDPGVDFVATCPERFHEPILVRVDHCPFRQEEVIVTALAAQARAIRSQPREFPVDPSSSMLAELRSLRAEVRGLPDRMRR